MIPGVFMYVNIFLKYLLQKMSSNEQRMSKVTLTKCLLRLTEKREELESNLASGAAEVNEEGFKSNEEAWLVDRVVYFKCVFSSYCFV